MRGKIAVNYFIIAILVLVVLGCSIGQKKQSAIGLKTTKDTLVSVATAAKRLCENGTLGENECKQIEDIYTQGRGLLIEAKAAWDVMVDLDSFDNRAKYENLIAQVTHLAGRIEGLIRE